MAEKARKTKKIRVEVKRELCIGAAACLAAAPQVFALDEENKAVVKDEKAAAGASLETLLDAARACPTAAIYLYDEEGKRIYPPPAEEEKPRGRK
jgi:ferredoxin